MTTVKVAYCNCVRYAYSCQKCVDRQSLHARFKNM